jgi:hypothetical protein
MEVGKTSFVLLFRPSDVVLIRREVPLYNGIPDATDSALGILTAQLGECDFDGRDATVLFSNQSCELNGIALEILTVLAEFCWIGRVFDMLILRLVHLGENEKYCGCYDCLVKMRG